jgi:hypothetical protein
MPTEVANYLARAANEWSALRASLGDCAESMRVFLTVSRLKPEDNETYAEARRLLGDSPQSR